ncbi:MAG: glycosyltransferase family 4 protein [Patescibacteria group bacterium]
MTNKKFTILFAHLAYLPPCIGKTGTLELARVLAWRGHRVHVVCCRQPDQPAEETLDGIQIHRLPFSDQESVWLSGRFAFALIKKIRRLNAAEPIDIIHVFNPFLFAGFTLFGLRLLVGSARRVFDIRTGSLRPGLRQKVAEVSFRIARRQADVTVSLDERLGQKLFPGKTTPTIPLGVNPELFKTDIVKRTELRRQQAISDDTTVFIYSGTLDRKRRLGILVAGFIKALLKLPKSKLILLGDGNDRPELERLAGRLAGNEILFTGRVPYHEVSSWLNIADAAVSYVPKMAIYEHQPPLKVPEYLAAELPVLATNTAGNETYVRNGYNGLIVPDSINGIEVGFLELSEKLAGLKKNTRSSIERFTWPQIVEHDLLPVYENLRR